jgi:hypothetical protein
MLLMTMMMMTLVNKMMMMMMVMMMMTLSFLVLICALNPHNLVLLLKKKTMVEKITLPKQGSERINMGNCPACRQRQVNFHRFYPPPRWQVVRKPNA